MKDRAEKFEERYASHSHRVSPGLSAFNNLLGSSEKKIVTGLRELLGKDLEDSRGLELIASVWYLLPKEPHSRRDVDQILELLVEHKPQFTKEELREALQRVLAFREKWRDSFSLS